MTQMWNYDKPHRCPECHDIWTAQAPVWEYDTLDGVTPRWWKTYTCRNCGCKFTGRWAWFPKMRDLYVHRIINWIIKEVSR